MPASRRSITCRRWQRVYGQRNLEMCGGGRTDVRRYDVRRFIDWAPADAKTDDTERDDVMSEPNETQQTPHEPDPARPVPDSTPNAPKPAPAQPEPPYGPTSIVSPPGLVPDDRHPKAPPSTPPAGSGQFAQQPAPGPTRPAGTPGRPVAAPQRGRVPTIHYELSYLVQNAERGPRGAIVLLHDLPGGAFVWQGVLPALAATGRAVYAFDLLGYGESDHPWPADCTVWGHADNLTPALSALGLEDIVLVGFGVGGGAAQVLATRMYRESTGALALVATYAYEYAYAPGWPLPDMEQRHDPEAPRHTSNDQLLADLRATLPTASSRPQFLVGSALDAYVREWGGDLGREVLYQHVRQMLPNYILSVASDLKELEVPSLVLWGERDEVTPLTLARRLARDIPGARLEVIAEAGHLLLDDAPDRVGAVLAEWINGLER